MDLKEQLSVLIRSNFSVVNLVSREETRILNVLDEVVRDLGLGLITWDVADNAAVRRECSPPFEFRKIKEELTLLDEIEKYPGKAVFVLKDFHLQIKEGTAGLKTRRKLRNLAEKLRHAEAKSIILLSPVRAIPEELKDDVHVLDVPLPTMEELAETFDAATARIRNLVNLSRTGKYKLIESSLGLTSNQFSRALSRILMTLGRIDERSIDALVIEKKQIIGESGALEFFPATETAESIGGLNNLKRWLKQREVGFTQEGRDYGLQYPPKGLALIGIPGTGKSLTAKVIARMWKMPLIRVDMGAIFGSLVGQSEENIRSAIRMAETVSPCILWIDEIEKGFAGLGSGGDSGTASRVFGHFLSWMQEKNRPVYVVATANDVSMLPQELWRDGRFDAKFFLNVPNMEERKEIFRVHLKKRRPMVKQYDLDSLARASENFVGAEIEQAIVDAMYAAINDPKEPGRDFETEDILAVLEQKTPQFESSKPQVQSILKWAAEVAALPASDTDERVHGPDSAVFMPYKKPGGRKLNLD
jgi:SpoVK/Ycf46/Vps4 family AAA+-type ATPase